MASKNQGLCALIGLVVSLAPGTARAKVLIVDTLGTYGFKTIQSAVAAADTGDTVFVKKGWYGEIGQIIVSLNIPVYLLGEEMDSTIISGDLAGTGIEINSEGCTISGFTLTGGDVDGFLGIECNSVSPTITYNEFHGLSPAGMIKRIGYSEIFNNLVQSIPSYTGIFCRGLSSPSIHNNNFINCMGREALIVSFDTMDIHAENNFWDTNDSNVIIHEFIDGRFDSTLGIVYFTPWLDTPARGISETENRKMLPVNLQCIPNPFRGKAELLYQVDKPGIVSFRVFDCTGRVVRTIVNQRQEPGRYRATWDGFDSRGMALPEGSYFVGFELNGRTEIKKAVLMR